jgi:hypothetical protein
MELFWEGGGGTLLKDRGIGEWDKGGRVDTFDEGRILLIWPEIEDKGGK